MEMEDDKLKALFAGFEPELTSGMDFVERLERNLHSVEIVRQRSAELRARSRKAVGIAAVAGFVVGILFSLVMPYLVANVAEWQLSLAPSTFLYAVADHFTVVAWTLACGLALAAALNAYDLSLALLKPKTNS